MIKGLLEPGETNQDFRATTKSIWNGLWGRMVGSGEFPTGSFLGIGAGATWSRPGRERLCSA